MKIHDLVLLFPNKYHISRHDPSIGSAICKRGYIYFLNNTGTTHFPYQVNWGKNEVSKYRENDLLLIYEY